MRLVEQAADQVQTSTIIDGDNPLSRIFLRSIAGVRESYPEAVPQKRSPEPPTVIFLDWIAKIEAFLR